MPAYAVGETPLHHNAAIIDLFADNYYEHVKKRKARLQQAKSIAVANAVNAASNTNGAPASPKSGNENIPNPTGSSVQTNDVISAANTADDAYFLSDYERDMIDWKSKRDSALIAQQQLAKNASKNQLNNQKKNVEEFFLGIFALRNFHLRKFFFAI